MELRDVRIEDGSSGRVRLVGRVFYDDEPRRGEDYWFEVSRDLAPWLSSSGNPWLVCLLPLAATLGQKLVLGTPTDRTLLRNSMDLLRLWRTWYPALSEVVVETEVRDAEVEPEPSRRAVFFSAGVDSFFTIRPTLADGSRGLDVDDLLAVHGFDIDLDQPQAFARHRARLERVSLAAKKELVCIATNLRETRLNRVPWGPLLHGPALVGVGLALERRYRELVISSTHDYRTIHPSGSHPTADPLMSTRCCRVVHYGAEFDRLAKTEKIAGWPLALQFLHVCFRGKSELNCGRCEKCLRTMLMLELAGKLRATPAFPWSVVDFDQVDRIHVLAGQDVYYRRIEEVAVSRGRRDIARAVRRCRRRSRRNRRLLGFADGLRRRRLLWRLGNAVRRRVLVGAIR